MNQKDRKQKNKIIELILGIVGGILAIVGGIPILQSDIYFGYGASGIISLMSGIFPAIFGIVGLIAIIISMNPDNRFMSFITIISGIIVLIFSYTLVLFFGRVDVLNEELSYLGIIGGIFLFFAGFIRILRT